MRSFRGVSIVALHWGQLICIQGSDPPPCPRGLCLQAWPAKTLSPQCPLQHFAPGLHSEKHTVCTLTLNSSPPESISFIVFCLTAEVNNTLASCQNASSAFTCFISAIFSASMRTQRTRKCPPLFNGEESIENTHYVVIISRAYRYSRIGSKVPVSDSRRYSSFNLLLSCEYTANTNGPGTS